tara:strand:- start:49 stop:180 length:132 start_codon:yes stop_codon:yes gene_type:complete
MGRQLTLEEVIKDCEDEANSKANKIRERIEAEGCQTKVFPKEH